LLPESLQQRAAEGEEFVPENAVTRTNGQPSLFLTVYKDAEANTVSTYHDVKDLLDEIDAEDESINIGIVFEQSSFVEESISGVAREGGLGAVFAIIIILLFLSSGLWSLRGRRRVGVVMIIIFLALLVVLTALGLEDAGNDWGEAFANSDIVFRVLLIGGVLAGVGVLFWPGDLPDPAYRATLVIAISIPLSILMAFIGMRWVSPAMYKLIQPLAEDSSFFAFILRLFPEELTLNIMTLSGLTVAVGRVVDDSIVVLENIFRQLESGEINEENKRAAVIYGTRDVSAAIFIATVVAVVVFLPLGLTGGIIGAFFLPFGLAVTYALAGSFLVAVTFVPVLAYLFINANEIPDEGDIWIAHYYLPVLRWALRNWKTKGTVILVAFASMIFGFYLFGQRPAAFLPDMGEPQIGIDIEMPPSTGILELNALVAQMEVYLNNPENVPQEQVRALEVIVGGGGSGFESLLLGSSVTENQASLTLGLDASVSPDEVDELTQKIRRVAELIFNCPMQTEGECTEDNVTVSSASIASQGMGGFELVVSGPEEEINRLDTLVIETLSDIEGVTNVTSNRTEDPTVEITEEDPNRTIIRVNQESALSYGGELETQDTIGITREAVAAIEALPEVQAIPGIAVSQGFASEIQTQGFNNMPIAMGIALIIVIITLIATFQSLVYWFALILSIVVAPVGAAVALTLADRVLGISALIGLLMLLGLVITNAVVLIDRVRSNRTERGMDLYDALVEAGGRRLRPILMTSLATIIALIPLAIGLSEGAIIASELGTVVIGGVVSSTLLTLIVVPVMYSILTPAHRLLSISRTKDNNPKQGGVNGD
jgi:HAE1 family hydrophobic/amphiphilic exporter-1